MHIAKTTEHYESWLATYTATVQKDLGHKHMAMARSAFVFLRINFYRSAGSTATKRSWSSRSSHSCSTIATAPVACA